MNKSAPQSQNNPNWHPLAEQSMPRLLFRLARERATGLLYLTFGEQRVTVILNQGAPVFANSNATQDSLGNLLLTRGIVNRAQLEEAVSQTKTSGKQLGAILVQKNLLTAQDLLQNLREQIKSIILKVFSWEGGHYYFENQQLTNREMISLVNNPLEIILSGVRQSFTLGRLMQEGVKQDVIFSLKPATLAWVESLNFGSVAEKILSLIDGKRNVKLLVEQSGAEALEALKAIFILWVMEKVEKIPAKESAAKPSKEVVISASEGPELIAPEQDARVSLDELPFKPDPDATIKHKDDFVISASKPGPAQSAKTSKPVILGDVEQLEKAYEIKKQSPQPVDPVEDLQEETLDEILPSAGKTSGALAADPNESTLEPKDLEKAKPAPAAPKAKVPEPKPKPAPAPLKPKVSETPPVAAVVEKSAPPVTVSLASGGWVRFTKYILFTGVISALFGASLGLFLYLDPESAAKYLDRIRLLKMYGQASLDAKRLGQFYEDDGKLKQAQAAFEKALQQTPTDDRLELTLAKVCQRLDEWEKAKKHLEAIIARNPALTDAHLALAWCYLHDGEVVRAKREFYLFLASSPVSPQTESIRRLVQGLQ